MAGDPGLYNESVGCRLGGGDTKETSPLQHVTAGQQKRQQEAQALKQKALMPQVKRCYILDLDVTVLVEYPDYRGPHHKGEEGAIYCENIVPCYQANRNCRYSGISPLFADPFMPRERPESVESEVSEDEDPPEEHEPHELDPAPAD